MTGYIYIITNTVNNKQYIGQTIRTIAIRFNGHISAAKNHLDETYLHRAMNKYGFDNFTVQEVVCVHKNSSEELQLELNHLEKYYIEFYNTLSPNGYNLTKGGFEGSESGKKKVDEYDLNGVFIKTHDSLIDAARSVNTQVSHSIIACCDGKSKYAFQKIWRYHGESLEQYELPNKKIAERINRKAPIDQYSKTGVYIQSFDSIVDALDFLEIKDSNHISECCKGKIHTAHGFVWRYKDDPFDIYNKTDKRFIGCKKYDINNNLLDTYSSIQDACISINKPVKNATSNISACCNRKKKTAYGFKWSYA